MENEEIDRAAIASEVFGGGEVTIVDNNPVIEHEDNEDSELDNEADEGNNDPWANVDPIIKSELEALKSKASTSDAIEERLKQAERRLGSVLNELHAAKEATKTASEAPSKEQIIKAAENQKAWDTLKDDWPEWAEGIENRIAATSAEIRSELPDIAAFREELSNEFNQRHADLESRLTVGIIASRHPNWRNDVDSGGFQTWRQDNNIPDTNDPAEVIGRLDAYYEYKKSKPSVKEIKAEREQRLKTAENVVGRKIETPKLEEDMSYEELRAHIAKETFK